MPQLWFRAVTEASRLLPPVCPACLGVGVRALDVPSLGPASDAAATAYYCDRCADLLNQRATRVVARLASAAVLGIGTATSVALALGGARLGLQIVLTVLVPLLPLALAALLARGRTGPALFHTAQAGSSIWIAERADFLVLLESSTTRVPAPGTRPSLAWELVPALAALVWLSGLHWLGRAELRVIQSADAEAVVLIDQRRRRTIAPTRAEHPHAAHAVSTLAGRRRLGIVTERGESLVDVVETLWPGRDYVLGTLPAGQCLFLERQEYGKQGAARDLAAVPGDGPLWELPLSVDLWFTALSERPSLPTSGGVRTALRLLPCR